MKTTRLALFAVLSAAVCLVAACEKDGGRSLDATDFPSSVDDPAIVEVSKAGSGTLQKLRLTPKADTIQDLHIDIVMKGGPMDMQMGMDMQTVVSKVHADGSFDVESSFTDMNMPAAAGIDPSIMKDILAKIKSTTTLSPRGKMSGSLDMGSDPALQSFSSTFEQLGFALPEEAVGVGATWSTKETLERNGLVVYQEIVYEIKTLDADKATMKMTITQRAPKQSVDMMGQSMTIEKMSTDGGGTLGIDFGKGMPTSMKLDLRTKTTMKVGDQKQSIDMNMDIDMFEQ
jgi:hypothetical protein